MLNDMVEKEEPGWIVQVSTGLANVHDFGPLPLANPVSIVSVIVAAPTVGPPVFVTVRVRTAGPPLKIGVECVAEIEREAGVAAN